jgi:hypothetical protein
MAFLLFGITFGVLFWIIKYSISTAHTDGPRVSIPTPDQAEARIPVPEKEKESTAESLPHLQERLGFAFAGAVIAASALFTFAIFRPTFSAEIAPQSDWKSLLIPIFYFAMMLAGMAGEYMFGLKRFKNFTVSEFVRPFWVSLIVFGVPWAMVDKSTLTFASILACYQNGFFWKSVLEKQRPKR